MGAQIIETPESEQSPSSIGALSPGKAKDCATVATMTSTTAGSSSLALSVTVAVAVAAAAFCWSYRAVYEAEPSSESKQGANGAKSDDKPQQRKQVEQKQAQQGAPSALLAIYDAIQGGLSKKGLNVDAVEGSRQYFVGLGGGSGVPNGNQQQQQQQAFWGSPQPIKYVDLPEPAGPLAFPTVRLLVIPLEDGPAMQSQAAAATRDIVSKLPPGDMFFNSRSHYHITMFHTSGLWEPVTDPMTPGGGFPSGARPCDRPRTPDGLLTREMELLEGLAGSTTPPVLEVDRIVFADSGVLLMLMVEVDGDSVGSIRSRGRELFPGMPEKQPNIIHVSLMRYLNPAALDTATTKAVIAACERWTERLRGKRFIPQNMWFVYEEEYSTIVGKRNILPMMASSAAL